MKSFRGTEEIYVVIIFDYLYIYVLQLNDESWFKVENRFLVRLHGSVPFLFSSNWKTNLLRIGSAVPIHSSAFEAKTTQMLQYCALNKMKLFEKFMRKVNNNLDASIHFPLFFGEFGVVEWLWMKIWGGKCHSVWLFPIKRPPIYIINFNR